MEEKQRQEMEQKIKAIDKSCSYKIELLFDKNGELCDKAELVLSGTDIGVICNATQLHVIIAHTVLKAILEKAKKNHSYKTTWLHTLEAVRFATLHTLEHFFEHSIKDLKGVEVNEKETAPQKLAQENQG